MATRRKHQKRLREKWGRERVLTERDCLRPGWERKATETERAEVLANTRKKREKRFTYQSRTYEGNFKLNTGASHGVVTHPVPEFTKSKNYPHQRLEKPSHLWADEVHASEKDVRRGNATKASD